MRREGPTIGVHLIAKDEARRLPRCLRSVAGFADEIVLVDTGSADGTPDIASAAGAIVVRLPWREDFAEARNAGLALASTDWILVLDADEEAESGAEELRAFLRETAADRCCVGMTHLTGGRPEDAVTNAAVRLFRAGRYRYEGRVHEQLMPFGSVADGRAPLSPLRLVHAGYLPEELIRKGTAARNLLLLEREAAERPDDPFTAYNLGVAYCQLGRTEEARAAFEAALARVPAEAPYRPTLVRDRAQLSLAERRHGAAIRLLAAETERYASYPDLHWLYGQCLRARGRLREATRAYEAALRCGETEASAYICQAGTRSYLPMTALADIAVLCGLAGEAHARYGEALAAEPAYAPAWRGWLETLGEPDGRELAARARERAGSGAAGLAAAARALGESGAYGAALELMADSGWREPALALRWLAADGRREEALALLGEPAVGGELRGADAALRELGAAIAWSLGRRRPAWLAEADAEAGVGEGGLARLEERLFARADGGCGLDDAATSASDEQAPAADAPAARAERLVSAALAIRQPDLALTLADAAGIGELALAKALHARGYADRAAERFIRLMRQGNLDAEGAFLLGETVFSRGHYAAAAGLFEQALARRGDDRRARLGAAECYLRLAKEVAEEAPEAARPAKELGKLDDSLRALAAAAGWRTAWTGAKKRNAHA